MTCQEAVSMIDLFLDDKLGLKETKAFMDHIASCPDCQDELEVRYMVRVSAGAFGEEDLPSYDLSHLLQDKLAQKKKWLRRMNILYLALLALLISVLAFMLIYFLF